MFFKKRTSELLPMFLFASLAFFFLIAVQVNTVRFHLVIVQHISIFSLNVFTSVRAEACRQIPNTAPRAGTFFAKKDPISTNNLGKAKGRAKGAHSARAALPTKQRGSHG